MSVTNNTLGLRNANRVQSVVITKKELTGLSLCLFDQAIDSRFSRYEFIITGLKVSVNLAVLRAQLSNDFGNTWLSTNYLTSYIAVFNAGASGVSPPSNFITISGFDGIRNDTASYGNNGILTLWNPSTNINKNYHSRFINYYPGGNFALVMGSGTQTTSTLPINAIRFFPSSGTFTGGSIQMIGYY